MTRFTYAKSLDHTLLALSFFNNAKHTASEVKAKKMISAGIDHLTKAAECPDVLDGIAQLEAALAKAHSVKARLESRNAVKAEAEDDEDLEDDEVEVDVEDDEVEVDVEDDEVDETEDEVDAKLHALSARLRRTARRR